MWRSATPGKLCGDAAHPTQYSTPRESGLASPPTPLLSGEGAQPVMTSEEQTALFSWVGNLMVVVQSGVEFLYEPVRMAAHRTDG